MIKGIDVSKHQGKIDWYKVKTNDIGFAILRAGYGSKASQRDTRFEENYKGCKENNIPVGVYWYSYALTVEGAEKEAEMCLETIKDKAFEYPIFFDIEDRTQLALSRDLIQKMTLAFCQKLEAAGYWVGIYSYKSFLENNFTADFFERYATWVAHTGVEKTTFKHPHGIWQHSHTGKVPGIKGNVDLNYSYKNYPMLMRTAGLNGLEKSTVSVPRTHKVVKNDTLWDLAVEYLGSGMRYKEIKSLNNLKADTIYVGQTLKIPNK